MNLNLIIKLADSYRLNMKPGYLRLYALLSVCGVALVCIGDFLFFHGFEGTNHKMDLSVLHQTPVDDITVGMYLCILGVGLKTFIVYPMRIALFKTNFALKQWILASFLVFLGCDLMFQVTLGFIGLNDHIADLVGVDMTDLAASIRKQTDMLINVIAQFGILSTAVFSSLFIVAIFKGQTLLPKWLVVFTPLLAVMISLFCPTGFINIDAPFGGWIDIAAGCISLLVFYLVINQRALSQIND